MKADCKGCIWPDACDDNYCGVILQKDDQICPCATCLVKMVCDNICDEWVAYDLYVNGDQVRG